MSIDPDSLLPSRRAVGDPGRVQGVGHSVGGGQVVPFTRPLPRRKRHFTDWLGAYMEYSKFSESPDKFHFWTGVSVIAGAVRKRVFIHKLTFYFDWTPNFYIVFVAPPGIVSKSTTANIGMDILKEVPDIHFGPNSVTWQSLLNEFEQARREVVRSDGSAEIMSAMTIVSSELGNLLTFKDTEMLDHLVNLWDGHKSFRRATKTQGEITIDGPWLNVLACTTPDWIAGNVPQYVIGGGFTSRCVFVYGEHKRKFVAYPGLQIPPGVREMRARLVEDLIAISELEGEFTLTPDALSWGADWYGRHNAQGINPDVAISGYMARKQTHLHKLAMVLSLSQSDDLVIDQPTLQRAADILEAAEAEMHKVFVHVGQTQETRAIALFIGMVRTARSEGLTYVAAYNKFCRSLTRTQFIEVVNSAIATGMIRMTGAGATAKFFPVGG